MSCKVNSIKGLQSKSIVKFSGEQYRQLAWYSIGVMFSPFAQARESSPSLQGMGVETRNIEKGALGDVLWSIFPVAYKNTHLQRIISNFFSNIIQILIYLSLRGWLQEEDTQKQKRVQPVTIYMLSDINLQEQHQVISMSPMKREMPHCKTGMSWEENIILSNDFQEDDCRGI